MLMPKKDVMAPTVDDVEKTFSLQRVCDSPGLLR